MRQRWIRSLLLAGLAACSTLPLLAAEAEEHTPTFLGLPTWIWLSANLALFLGILGYYLGPPMKNFLEARAKEIRDNLNKAQDQRQESQNMKASLESQVADLQKEMDEVLARAQADGEKERHEILAQADRERERLLRQTEQEIELRVAQALSELTKYTAKLAADLAREKLAASIGPEDTNRLFDKNLGRLEQEIQ